MAEAENKDSEQVAEGKQIGRTDYLLPIKDLTKVWAEYQTETLGLDLDKGELLEDFMERLASNIVAAEGIRAQSDEVKLTELQQKELTAWQKKADTLTRNKKERVRFQAILADHCGLRARSSQRATSLTQEEELTRQLLSWRVWDLTCQVAARRETEISFADQLPAWLRLEPEKAEKQL